jgi:hypothetical protein
VQWSETVGSLVIYLHPRMQCTVGMAHGVGGDVHGHPLVEKGGSSGQREGARRGRAVDSVVSLLGKGQPSACTPGVRRTSASQSEVKNGQQEKDNG